MYLARWPGVRDEDRVLVPERLREAGPTQPPSPCGLDAGFVASGSLRLNSWLSVAPPEPLCMRGVGRARFVVGPRG